MKHSFNHVTELFKLCGSLNIEYFLIIFQVVLSVVDFVTLALFSLYNSRINFCEILFTIFQNLFEGAWIPS